MVKMVEKEKVIRKVVCRLVDKQCLERDTRVDWKCTLPQETEPRVAKEVEEEEVNTREAMRAVGATLMAIHKALHQEWC